MLKNETLVSIGIPFYNSEKYLKDAIKSVIKQTYSNWELILLDDGSDDNSLEIAHKYEEEDERIKVISDGENLGLPKRLNQLSELSKGYYYARMDADDIMFPNRIEKQIEYLNNNKNVDLLGSGLVSIDNKNNIIGIRTGDFSNYFTLKDALKSVWCPHPTISGKREWFLSNKYDESLRRSQDYELWIRTVEKSNFVRLKEPYLFYREASTPSLKKYIKSTQYSLLIFFKNRYKIGVMTILWLSLIKFLKLFAYFFYFMFGQTDKLIQRRAQELKNDLKEYYDSILKNLTT